MSPLTFNTIKGSTNVITGCGSGLGKATLKWFLKNNCGPVLGIDRHFEKNYEDHLELTADQKSKITLKEHDTFDDKAESSMEEFVSKYGTVDNVINIAGIALAYNLYWKNAQKPFELDHAYKLFEFNTVGTFNIIRLASKYMIDRSHTKFEGAYKTKAIINTSCISTSAPNMGQSFYAGSKASIDSLTLCIAREFSPYNIRCNTINVGYFDTKLLRSSETNVCNFIKSVSLCPKRLGHPDEFAHLVQAIIENQMLNGCCIKLDGGTRDIFI